MTGEFCAVITSAVKARKERRKEGSCFLLPLSREADVMTEEEVRGVCR